VVGDIAVLEPGEIVPVDGIFIQGHGVECDESSATGETHSIKKAPFQACVDKGSDKMDCFLISGAKVLEGSGTYVVVAIGTRSSYGRLMMGAWLSASNAIDYLTFLPFFSSSGRC